MMRERTLECAQSMLFRMLRERRTDSSFFREPLKRRFVLPIVPSAPSKTYDKIFFLRANGESVLRDALGGSSPP